MKSYLLKIWENRRYLVAVAGCSGIAYVHFAVIPEFDRMFSDMEVYLPSMPAMIISHNFLIGCTFFIGTVLLIVKEYLISNQASRQRINNLMILYLPFHIALVTLSMYMPLRHLALSAG